MFSLDANQVSNKTKRNNSLFCTHLEDVSHQFVLGHQTGSFSLARLEIAILRWLFDEFKGYWNGYILHMVQAIEQVETLHSPTLTMIIMPAHHFVFIGVRLFLNGIVKNQYRILPFHLANRPFDFQPQVFRGVL